METFSALLHGPLCGEFTGHRGTLMFSLICTWSKGDGGDLRRHHAQYDVIVIVDVHKDTTGNDKDGIMATLSFQWSETSCMMTSSNGNIFRLLANCAGNSPVTGEFPAQRPVTRSFDVFFDLLLKKRLSKQWWCWWFETSSRPLWRHCNRC